ncbi:peroxidase-like [Copidosoma floridanum]|uniref:peroxidase-like n=1 Tax=Copidosoma floridanum TaxID=29053 RepID=UPI0006C9CA1D|nr:peroxidase-like [Copidosoma floridanum]
MGRSSSFGSYLDGGWLSDSVCIDNWNVYCPVYAARYRKFDGSCNHPDQLGMALTPFQRTLPPDYADGIDAPRIGVFGNPLPSARKVSLKVHTPLPSSNPSFTVMLAVFGQFLDHDLTATAISQGRNGSSLTCCPPNGGSHPECFSVEVGPGDPVFDLTNTTCLEFIRSAPAPQCKVGSRQQLNQVTSFIDGSMIYGSDENTAKDLRYFLGGQLRMQVTQDDRLLLPASTNPFDGCNRQLELARGRYCFASGDVRANENLHLTTMHLLWARQHNRLANQFSQINPNWNDEIIYQEVRRIVGAQIQHIAYTEFLPIVIGKTEMSAHDIKPLAEGFRPKNDSDNINPAIANNFAAAAFRFAHTLLPGLMRVTDELKGTTSYVQLHKMLFNPYSLYSKGGVESSITTATSNTIQDTSTHVTSQLTAHLFEDPLENKTIPCGLDLVSLNIQRGRDHGLPGYTKWRKYCGLKIPHNFGDLKDDMDPAALDSISELYENVDDLDLYTGALAEIHDGDKLLGPTFTCLIADQFKRLQKGDKFWYEFGDHPGSFTEDQLKELRKSSLARIICDTSDGIEKIQASVMRSIGPDNPVVACEDIPQLSLNPWKTLTPLITVFETDIPMMDWLRFQSEVNKTINSIISNILNKKSPFKSLTSHWFFFQHNLRTLFEDLKIKFAALNPKMITDTNFKKNTSDFNLFLIEDMINSGISNIENFLSMDVLFLKSSLEDWINFKRNLINTLLIIENEFNDINVNLNKLQSYWREIFTLKIIPINWDSIKYDMNATISDVILTINAHNVLFNGTFPIWSMLSKKTNTSLWSIRHQPNIRQFKHINLLNQTIPFDNKTNFNVHEGNHNYLRTLEHQFTIKNNTNSLWSQIRNQSMVDFEFGSDRIFVTKKALSETKKKKNFDRVIKVIKDTFYETQKKNHTFTKLKQKYTYFYAKIQGKKKELLKNFAEDVKIYNSSSEDFLQNVIAKLLHFVKTKKPIPDHPKHVWFTYKTVVKGLFMQANDQIKNFKIHQILQCGNTIRSLHSFIE